MIVLPGVALLFASAIGSPEIDLDLALRYFAEAEQLSAEDGGALWGHELAGPMIFLDPGSASLVANRPVDGLEERGFVWTGPLPDDLGVANTAQVWRGERWTTMIWPLPADDTARRRLLAHELFHRIQPLLAGCSSGNPKNEHLDTAEGRIWLRLEWRALVAALASEGEERHLALRDALLFRWRRHELFPAARTDELALESNEGVAEYTGHRLCGLGPEGIRAQAAARLRGEERAEKQARSFAYASGPAWALLLDDLLAAASAESWRAGFACPIDLAGRVARAAEVERPGELEREAEERALAHGGETVREEELGREQGRAAREALLRRRFVDGPLLVLPLGDGMRYSFDPYAVESLPGAGQVYDTLSVNDAWGILEVERDGALMSEGPGGSFESVRVPAPGELDPGPDGLVTGDGWTLELAPGWSLAAGDREGDLVGTDDR